MFCAAGRYRRVVAGAALLILRAGNRPVYAQVLSNTSEIVTTTLDFTCFHMNVRRVECAFQHIHANASVVERGGECICSQSGF